ncbi:hypothetical protein K6T82_11495 [Flavobacterium sp. 17A]|uniref:Uncharacterized protein n=1 Tax=Flavobacterium potami TaxID=2872310 RepID=A0A9X1KQ07_9FLAO|nr:hypothetical protein [Flavobacterium potami]MBZ4035393.1 hypothetical protein [Flavobacterium potami]
MKNWCTKLFLSIVILLNGYGNVYAHATTSKVTDFSSSLIFKTNFNTEHQINRGRTFESFKRKICLFDNEENEENFSSVQKQIVKSNYFLIFHCNNQTAVSTTAFTKKVNDCKIFSLLDNKVYLLFQVFRI